MMGRKTLANSHMEATRLVWMGQAGFIIKSTNGQSLGIDLYLSDCVESVEGHDGYHRLMPQIANPKDLMLDVVVSTHFHRDHFDIDAMPKLMENGKTRLFCAYDCEEDVKRLGIDESRTIYVAPGDHYEVNDFVLDFIHSDHGASAPLEVGVIITVDGMHILNVGDTSLHLDWKDEYLKCGNLDVLIAPINGAYGNLNEQDNVHLTKYLEPRLTIPSHFGMFASHGGNPGDWRNLIIEQAPKQMYKIFTQGEIFDL